MTVLASDGKQRNREARGKRTEGGSWKGSWRRQQHEGVPQELCRQGNRGREGRRWGWTAIATHSGGKRAVSFVCVCWKTKRGPGVKRECSRTISARRRLRGHCRRLVLAQHKWEGLSKTRKERFNWKCPSSKHETERARERGDEM